MKKLVNGVEVTMSAQEIADFEASRTPTLGQAKAEARQRIVARAKLEADEDRLLEVQNPVARLAATRANARSLFQQVQAANSVAEVQAINLDAGW